MQHACMSQLETKKAGGEKEKEVEKIRISGVFAKKTLFCTEERLKNKGEGGDFRAILFGDSQFDPQDLFYLLVGHKSDGDRGDHLFFLGLFFGTFFWRTEFKVISGV